MEEKLRKRESTFGSERNERKNLGIGASEEHGERNWCDAVFMLFLNPFFSLFRVLFSFTILHSFL
jgi:hypothetical protein